MNLFLEKLNEFALWRVNQRTVLGVFIVGIIDESLCYESAIEIRTLVSNSMRDMTRKQTPLVTTAKFSCNS
jgi:hypothetical protein